jgi:hypothetical protein
VRGARNAAHVEAHAVDHTPVAVDQLQSVPAADRAPDMQLARGAQIVAV